MKWLINFIIIKLVLNSLTVLVDHLLKTKKEFKSLKGQEIQSIFTKMN